MNEESNHRWYGPNRSQNEKEQFDNECREEFQHALEAIAPEKVELPEWRGYEWDVEHAGEVCAPFLKEVQDAQREKGEKEGSERLLAITILLDQLTRNIYRDPAGLRKVFTHYDRLAHTLIHSALHHLSPSPIFHPSHTLRPVIRQWFLLPLMHSEHLPSHNLFLDIAHQAKRECEEAGDGQAVADVERNLRFEEMHLSPLRKFGRYPHRNEALGRVSTGEEREWLGRGETFGVSQGKEGERDEL